MLHSGEAKVNKIVCAYLLVMDLRISEKRFVCVDYPGIVQNRDAMLQTLGGAAEVSKVILVRGIMKTYVKV